MPSASFADLVGEGRREHEVLALGREQGDDPPDVVDEAHVEHPIGLVEDEDLDRAEVDGALADVVEQPAGRGDDDLGTTAQGAELTAEPDAAVDRGRADRSVAAIRAEARLDLDRELTRRREDEDPNGRARSRSRLTVGMEPLDDRQDEGGGLAGPGLGAGEDVATCQDVGDRVRLHGGGVLVAFVGHGSKELGRQPEFSE